MLWRTHFALGIGTGALYGTATYPHDPLTAALFAGISGAASLLPDVDSPHSKLGSKVRPVSDVLNLTLGHRGLLHSLAGMSIVLVVATLVSQLWLDIGWLVPAIALGYLSHLILDLLTPGGVPLLWPMRKTISLPLARTGSFIERVVIFPALAVFAGIVFWGMIR